MVALSEESFDFQAKSISGNGEGFDVEEHPWLEPYHDEAFALVKEKVPTGDMTCFGMTTTFTSTSLI